MIGPFSNLGALIDQFIQLYEFVPLSKPIQGTSPDASEFVRMGSIPPLIYFPGLDPYSLRKGDPYRHPYRRTLSMNNAISE